MISDVAIIGAGPYGLSVAAHLKARGVGLRIFGSPLQSWRTQMPAGMFLKSEGFASSLSDPGSAFTLAHHCAAAGIPYADVGQPVALETFQHYGVAFQQRFVPDLEEQPVARLESAGHGFRLSLEDGSVADARRVVIAAGLSHFAHVPAELAALAGPHIAHSTRLDALGNCAGRDVIVIGAGSSAIDSALALHDAGASVRVVARRPVVRFHEPPRPRSLLDELRAPMSGLGPGWRSRLCTDAPMLFHVMPQRFRLEVARRHLGPAPGWWTKPRIDGAVGIHPGMRVHHAAIRDSRVVLDLMDQTGQVTTMSADHVVAATGFRVDVRRLPFVAPELCGRIRTVEQTPILSGNFETSVPGLYFVGAAAANSFGPMMRFVYGADYSARRLGRHLARSPATVEQGPADTGVPALSYNS